MRTLNFFLILSFLTHSTLASAIVCPTKEYIRDVEQWDPATGKVKKWFSRSAMYEPMVEGAADIFGSVVFVDADDWGNEDMLANYPDMNKSLFAQYDKAGSKPGARGRYSSKYAYKGIFKISYLYNATECRRQIILGKHQRKKNKESKGYFNGFTAIEICNPGIAALFTQGKATLGAGNMQTIEQFLSFVEDLHHAGKIDDQTFYQIQDNLSMNKTQKKAVMYYRDEDNDILPRFAVKLNRFFWKQIGDNCEMVVDHKDGAQDYAGLATSFPDDYQWTMSLDPEESENILWYWDLSTYVSGALYGEEYNYVEVKNGL